MYMDYDMYMQHLQQYNEERCAKAFSEEYPDKDSKDSELCNDGDFHCTTCPWRKDEDPI